MELCTSGLKQIREWYLLWDTNSVVSQQNCHTDITSRLKQLREDGYLAKLNSVPKALTSVVNCSRFGDCSTTHAIIYGGPNIWRVCSWLDTFTPYADVVFEVNCACENAQRRTCTNSVAERLTLTVLYCSNYMSLGILLPTPRLGPTVALVTAKLPLIFAAIQLEIQ